MYQMGSIQCNLKRSVVGQRIVVGLHLLAVLPILLSSVSVIFGMMLVAILVVHARYFLRHHIWLTGRHSVRGLRYYDKCWWLLIEEQWTVVRPVDEAIVLPWLMCFYFLVDNNSNKKLRKVPVILWTDSAENQSLHHLRLRLLLDACFI
ncbi:hypothetical protein CI610_01639 [invertebrate metagenome]|uniref:Toxin CptA n=1 Tax=invertebrate metagenome TaxID=1711999 RepID=A0A2H9T838_9ZZZZ